MTTVLSTRIRVELRRYLMGEISLQAFDAWFTPATWNVEQSGDVEAEWLSNQVMLRLAEFSRGHWREEELRDHFASLQPMWLDPAREAPSSAETTTVIVSPRALTAGPKLRFRSEPEQDLTRAAADPDYKELKIPA